MNINESIRRILREESSIPLALRRRVSYDDIEEAFQDSLDDAIESAYNSKSVFWRVRNDKRWWVFSKWVIDDMITLLEQEFFSDDNRVYFDDGDFYYEKIRKPLIAYYKDRLEEAFYEILKNKNIQESIRRILREEKEIPGYLRRRLYIADEYMDNLNPDSLHDGWVMDQIDEFVRGCMGAITRMIISKTSEYIDEDNYMKQYDEIYGFLIKLGYQKRLFRFFYDVMMDRWSKSFDDK